MDEDARDGRRVLVDTAGEVDMKAFPRAEYCGACTGCPIPAKMFLVSENSIKAKSRSMAVQYYRDGLKSGP